MTTVPPRRRPTPRRRPRPGPASTGRHLHPAGPPLVDAVRTAVIYRIPVYEIDARTGMILLYDETGRKVGFTADLTLPHHGQPKIVFDYVGQTVRGADIREAEHIDEKCWADLIAGRIQVIDSGVWTKAERDAREIRAIRLLKPRFNYDHNLDNPDRVEIWRQVELRHARDRAAGRPLWIPLEQRTPAAVAAAQLDVVQGGLDGREPRYLMDVAWSTVKACGRFLASLSRRTQVIALLCLAAVAGTVVGTALLIGGGWPAPYALAGTGTLAAVGVWAAPKPRRRRRARRRKRP